MDPWVQSFGHGVNKTSAAILPPSRGLCSSSFHPFLPSPAPLSLYLTLHSFLLLADIGSKFFFSPSRTFTPLLIHPEYLQSITPCRTLLIQGSASAADGALCFNFFFFFYVQPQCDICSPLLLDKCLWIKNAAAHTVRNI